MARRLRVEYPGAIYHVINRGDRRESIFRDDADRERCVLTLGEACAKTGWQIHAYVLMPNHFHLVVETPRANLVAGMKWFLGTYTNRFNRRHGLVGHLFSGRYKSMVVDGSGSGYLKSVCDYVHLNPSRAGLIALDQPLKRFTWSSWPAFLRPPSKRPVWLRLDRWLGECGIPQDSWAGRRQLEMVLETRRGEGKGGEFDRIRHDWCFGDTAFRQELLSQVNGHLGVEHYGAERAQTAEAMALDILAKEMMRMGWDNAALEARPKGDRGKLVVAVRLRRETTMTVAWIAQHLKMGSRGYLDQLLYRSRKSGDDCAISRTDPVGDGSSSS